jgi:hypothetical protein
MKIEWSTVLAFVIAMAIFKLVDTLLLDKVISKIGTFEMFEQE